MHTKKKRERVDGISSSTTKTCLIVEQKKVHVIDHNTIRYTYMTSSTCTGMYTQNPKIYILIVQHVAQFYLNTLPLSIS